MFPRINVSVVGAVDALKGYVASRWHDFQCFFRPKFAYCKATIKARTARARFVAKDFYDRARVALAPAVAVVADSIRPVRERLVALAPPFRRGFALAASLPMAFI